MSRTYKDRGYHRKLVRNSFMQKEAKEWAEDFGGTRGKHRDISRRVRRRLKTKMIKEMESMNEVILIGNLTSDVELRTNEKGTSVVSTTVAINRGTDENGKERPADFIKFYAFNNIAENMPKYCRKGSKICVKGRIVNRSWDKEDGSKAYQTTVYASRVMFLDSRKSNYIPLPEAPEPNFKTPVAEQQEDPFASFGGEVVLNDDDLPF